MNKTLELEEAKARIAANISKYISEIAKINGVSKKEAKRILEENLKVNNYVLERSSKMRLEEAGATTAGKASKQGGRDD